MNNLPLADPRDGVLNPQPLQQDLADQRAFSAYGERHGHIVNTTPSSALPISFELETTTRTDPNAENLTGGVLTSLTVGMLPSAFGINYDG